MEIGHGNGGRCLGILQSNGAVNVSQGGTGGRGGRGNNGGGGSGATQARLEVMETW